MTVELDFPALQKTANRLSDRFQRKFLWLIRGEYFALFVASIMALELTDAPAYYIMYAIILVVGMTTLLTRSISRPEQSWYRARAAAESIKTSAWRYAMIAHPYNESEPRIQFLNFIESLLKTNRILSENGDSQSVGSDQITSTMEELRTFPLGSRVAFYIKHRMNNQLIWYQRKARLNKRAYVIWAFLSGSCYSVAIVLAFTKAAYQNFRIVPIDPLIIVASSVVGWVQIKRHTELASSYTLTATEIKIAIEKNRSIMEEKIFSDFVNDAELAFSREHTQWIARQQTAG